jgi:hypothetical protein
MYKKKAFKINGKVRYHAMTPRYEN